MNLTDSFVLKCQLGAPVLYKDICAIYPATLRKIVTKGYDSFQKYLSVIMTEKPVLKDSPPEMKEIMKNLTDFTFFLLMTSLDADFAVEAKQAFRFFINENVIFSLEPAQIIVGPLEEKHIINEEDFYEFRRIIKRMYLLEQEGEEIIISEEDSPRLKALKQQMRENRQKLAKAKAKKKSQEKSDIKFSDLVGSVALAVPGLNMINIWDLTYYAFHDQLTRMGWKEKYEMNSRAALAGAKIKKSELSYWLKSMQNSDDSNQEVNKNG